MTADRLPRLRDRARRGAAVGPVVVATATLLFLGVFLLWPLAHVAEQAFVDEKGATVQYVVSIVTDEAQREAVGASALIAVCTTLLCIALALPPAWLFARRSFRGKALLAGLMLLPLVLPPFVGAVGMRAVFARAGPLSTLCMRIGLTDAPVDWLGAQPLAGVVVVEALHLFPILFLNLIAAFANVDPSLEEAARNLGATPWRTFRRVTLPLAAPGLFAGSVLVFVWSFTELGTPLVFNVRNVLPVRIYDRVNDIGSNPTGYALTFFVLAVTVLGFLLSKRLTRRERDVATLGRLSQAAEEKPLSAGATVLVWCAVGGLVLLAAVPHAGVVLTASTRRWFLTVLPEDPTLEFYGQALASDMTRGAVFNSMALALGASLVDIVFGFALAWICVRRRMWGSDWLDALAMLPLAAPGLVVAFGYMGCFPSVFGEDSALAPLLNPRVNPMFLLAMSYAVRRLPYMVRSCHAGLEQVDVRYEEAAANLGATPLRTVLRITLPLVWANLLAGVVLCFSFSMLEVADSLVLAQQEAHYPITKAIYKLVTELDNGVSIAAALGVWAMLLLGSALLWVSALMGKSVGRIFRAG